jgi:hypothetical protein
MFPHVPLVKTSAVVSNQSAARGRVSRDRDEAIRHLLWDQVRRKYAYLNLDNVGIRFQGFRGIDWELIL